LKPDSRSPAESLLEGPGRALGHVPLERDDIYVHRGRTQGERLI
jgi:hypothetical protein